MTPLQGMVMSSSVIERKNPCCPFVPYALDSSTTGLHILLPIERFTPVSLAALFAHLEVLSVPGAVRREHEVYRIAWDNHTCVGSVYDIPTTCGWAALQNRAFVKVHLAALQNSKQTTYAVPRALLNYDDIRPDENALPEVTPYTQFAAVLYEALDCLQLTTGKKNDLHLRNLYPYTIWSSGVLFSESQVRRLAPHPPAPRNFSRSLECPNVGEILGAPGEVRRHGWITFFHALVPTYLSGGVQFGTGVLERFIPRSSMALDSVAVSLILEDLTFAEVYYLVRIEQLASRGQLRTVYHRVYIHTDTSLGLAHEFVDKALFCEALGVKVVNVEDESASGWDLIEYQSRIRNRELAYAEQAMCDAMPGADEDCGCEDAGTSFVYKRDARLDFATLDGYDGWCDEELTEKKYKSWAVYRPNVLMPSEIAALYCRKGVRLYGCDGKLTIICEYNASQDPTLDGCNDVHMADVGNWTELRAALEAVGPRLPKAADRFLLSLVVSGQIRLYGYYHCADASEQRHYSRGIGVFMDEPLWVLGFKLQEKQLTFRSDERECLLVPVGPSCTILMRGMTEKYSTLHGRVHHSERVQVLPFGCRLGERRHLKWYAVGAGAWEPSETPPKTLVEVAEEQLKKLSCSASANRDHILVTAKKGLSSVRLRDIGIEAGWSSWSPHLIITGNGKRITSSVRTHSLTHLVDVLRHIRDKSKENLALSIQEIAAALVLKDVLIGGLHLTRRPLGLEWAPRWKLADEGFLVAHAMRLPRGAGCKELNADEQTFAVLVTRDTMAVFKNKNHDSQDGVWNWVFMGLDAGIESEKLLVGPNFEGFANKIVAGIMGVSE